MGVATVTMVASLVGILGVGLGFGLARLVSARKACRSQDEHREAIHGLKIELERARAELTGQEKSAQKAEEVRKTTEEAFLGQLRDALGNLAGDALRDNSQMFLSQAAEQLKPITEQLHHLSKATSQVEGGRRAAFNEAVGSYEGSVIPSGRKLEKFKIADQSKKELEAPEAIDTPVRTPKETAPHV
jgi:hypothetical protein